MSKGMNKNTSIKTINLVREIGSGINWNEKKNKQFVEAFLALENANETQCFLRDLMTETEIKEFANRLEAASLLTKDVQYNSIIESTGLSSTTIARIAKWLNGSLGGYRLILNRISNHHHNSPKIRKGLSLSS
ncbi:MAG: YerC/YecD family TrpR-related protein [Candidatus Paceibacterota bacterium]